MPKIKTNRGAAKRFKKSASGRIKRGGAFTSHILTPKSRKRKRNLRHGGMVAACGPEKHRQADPVHVIGNQPVSSPAKNREETVSPCGSGEIKHEGVEHATR